MPIHEIHELPDGVSIRVAVRRPKRDRKIRRADERHVPHLGNKQKLQTTPVDESTIQNQTKPFFTQESTMTQATTQTEAQTTQAAQAETQASFQEQLKDLKKEVQQQEKSSFWKTAATVAVAAVAAAATVAVATGGYFAWKNRTSS